MAADQNEHYNKLDNISVSHSVMADTTVAGGGKTIIPLVFAYRKKIKRIIVLCPGYLHCKHWIKHRDMYNSPIIHIITYDQLRGSTVVDTPGNKIALSHGLLYRHYGDIYEPTELFNYYVEEGGLLIISDEFHLIKNDDCGKTKAVRALTRRLAIRNMQTPQPISRSFLYFSSMTPFDDIDHVINFGFLSGVIRSESLYDRENGNLTGLLDLYQYCNYFDPMKTAIIWGTSEVKLDNVKEITYRLLTEIYLRIVSSFVRDCHKNFLSKQSIFYAYFDIEPIGVDLMKRALAMIRSKPKGLGELSDGADKFLQDALRNHQNNIVDNFTKNGITIPTITPINDNKDKFTKNELDEEFNKITNGQGVNINNRSGVMYGTMTSQSIKTYYASLRFIQCIFSTVPNVKVIIFLNYKESVDIIMRFLSYLRPVSITGDHTCTEQVRNDIIERFNQPNLDLRLLLIMSQIGSDGIELDDTHGGFPRISIGLPDFYNSRYFQCPGRTFRRYTRSNSLYFLIMINSDECSEESLDKSINNKSKVMIDTLRNNEIIPPMNFEKIYNPDKMDINKLLANAGNRIENKESSNITQIAPIIKIKKCSVIKTF